MKHRILVIDDRLDEQERFDGYNRLAREVEARVSGFEIEMFLAMSPTEIPLMLRQNRYSAVLVDAVLDEKWPSWCDLDFVLGHIDSSIPIALLSSHWDDTNSVQLNRALQRQNCHTVLHWRDIAGRSDGSLEYAVAQFVGLISAHHKLRVTFEDAGDHNLRILHISDLQFGGIEEKRLRLEAVRSAERVLEAWGRIPPDFVAFTGDIAEHGNPSEYSCALEWLEFFFDRLGLTKKAPFAELLIVPGNHDVNVAIAAASRIELTRGGKSNILSLKLQPAIISPDLIAQAYTPFRQFLERSSDVPLLIRDVEESSFAWVESRYRHLGVIFYGINTAGPASANGLPDRLVDANALARIGVEITKGMEDCSSKAPVVIGLGHHCPVSAVADRSVTNTQDFSTFFKGDNKTALFLHGHIHEQAVQYISEDGFRMVRSCASTLTKDGSARPPDSLRGFNLVELSPGNGWPLGNLKISCYAWIGSNIKPISTDVWVRDTDGMFREIKSAAGK